MSKTPTVAITGAGGFLGTKLVEHFAAKGWLVRALVRNPKQYEDSASVQYVAYDLEKPVGETVLKGVDCLVHAAFIKYDRKHPDAFDKNVTAAKNIIKASRSQKLKRNVFISSMSSHEDAVSVYGRQKLAIESVFDGSQDVSLRPGLIMGEGGIVKEMAAFMKSKHAVPLIDGGKQPLQVVAVQDLVNAIDAALTSNVSGVLTIATPEIYTYKQFYQALANGMGIKVLFLPVPFWLLLGIMQTVAALHLPLSVNTDSLWGLKKLRSADTAPDLKRLGISLKALPEIIEDMKAAKLL